MNNPKPFSDEELARIRKSVEIISRMPTMERIMLDESIIRVNQSNINFLATIAERDKTIEEMGLENIDARTDRYLFAKNFKDVSDRIAALTADLKTARGLIGRCQRHLASKVRTNHSQLDTDIAAYLAKTGGM